MTLAFLLRVALAGLIAFAIAAFIALRPAHAATLRGEVTVAGAIVTLGDLFEGAGPVAGMPVFRSPDLGVEGSLPAAAAIAAAREAGLPVDPTPHRTVRVVRLSVAVTAQDLERMVLEAAARRLGVPAEDVAVAFDQELPALAADGASEVPAALQSLSLSQASGRFRAAVAVDVGEEQLALALAGTVSVTRPVVVAVRPIGRGEVIRTADVALERRDLRRVDPGVAEDPEAVVGQAARRALRPGDMVAGTMVEPPRLVRRGDLVTLSYAAPGLTLTARGRAMNDAALGEPVTVLNEQSRRQVEGVADGPGTVRIEGFPVRTARAADLTETR
jgi:flagella basal body P-ring formation protein FlgA